jgi:hypothetical protein
MVGRGVSADKGIVTGLAGGFVPHSELLLELEAIERDLVPVASGRPARALLRSISACKKFLQRPIRIAFCGEFNSGKSALVNRLLGHDAMPTSVLACTRIATRIHFAEAAHILVRDARGRAYPLSVDGEAPFGAVTQIDVGLPIPAIGGREFLDLPEKASADGLMATFATFGALPDVLVWCTSSTQPWKESERALWQALPGRVRNNSVLAATFPDLITSDTDRGEIVRRLRAEAIDFSAITMVCGAAPDPDAAGEYGVLGGPTTEDYGLGQFKLALDAASARAVLRREARVRRFLARVGVGAGLMHDTAH